MRHNGAHKLCSFLGFGRNFSILPTIPLGIAKWREKVSTPIVLGQSTAVQQAYRNLNLTQPVQNSNKGKRKHAMTENFDTIRPLTFALNPNLCGRTSQMDPTEGFSAGGRSQDTVLADAEGVPIQNCNERKRKHAMTETIDMIRPLTEDFSAGGRSKNTVVADAEGVPTEQNDPIIEHPEEQVRTWMPFRPIEMHMRVRNVLSTLLPQFRSDLCPATSASVSFVER